MKKYEKLKLENQLCFPLYAVSKEITKKYKAYLDPLDLTYTQYIVMQVLWDLEAINIKELGNRLMLDSGTLTPLVKKLASKGYVTRNRCMDDERCVIIKLTDKGRELADRAVEIPDKMSCCIKLTEDEKEELIKIMNKIMKQIRE